MTLRLSFRAVVTAAVIGCGLFGATVAETQDVPPASPAETAPAATLPQGPVPYTATVRRRAPRPQRAASPAATPPTATAPTPSDAAAPTPSPVLATPATPLPVADLEAYVDGVVRDRMARDHIAGVTIAVVQNGQVVLKKGYGVASLKDGRKVDPDKTLFRIGSISKTFTWIALMHEVEAGRMSQDTPNNI